MVLCQVTRLTWSLFLCVLSLNYKLISQFCIRLDSWIACIRCEPLQLIQSIAPFSIENLTIMCSETNGRGDDWVRGRPVTSSWRTLLVQWCQEIGYTVFSYNVWDGELPSFCGPTSPRSCLDCLCLAALAMIHFSWGSSQKVERQSHMNWSHPITSWSRAAMFTTRDVPAGIVNCLAWELVSNLCLRIDKIAGLACNLVRASINLSTNLIHWSFAWGSGQERIWPVFLSRWPQRGQVSIDHSIGCFITWPAAQKPMRCLTSYCYFPKG
jgi:hypothetical protein